MVEIVGDTMGIAHRGVVSVAWAVGRVAGVIARALRMSWRPAPGSGRTVSERNVLLAEIARLDGELDQVYYLVARGDRGLAGLLSRLRELKKKLRKARARLKRLDRDAAMDRRFRRTLFSGSRSQDLPDIGKIAQLRERYDFEDEEGEFEFESLLDGDP